MAYDDHVMEHFKTQSEQIARVEELARKKSAWAKDALSALKSLRKVNHDSHSHQMAVGFGAECALCKELNKMIQDGNELFSS